jgi:hypothetical protein
MGHPKGDWDLVGANGFDPAVPHFGSCFPDRTAVRKGRAAW